MKSYDLRPSYYEATRKGVDGLGPAYLNKKVYSFYKFSSKNNETDKG